MIPNKFNAREMKNFFGLCCALFMITNGWSQTYKGEIANISEDGLHKILLTPEIRSVSASNVGFIRLLDGDKNEVSYFVMDETNALTSTFLPFSFNSENSIKDSITSIVIENIEHSKLDHFIFEIANTQVNKTYSVSGSNDKKEWFGLINQQVLYGINENEKTTVERTFSFPLNDYKYIKFEFEDKNSLPLNIMAVGLYKNTFIAGSKIAITDYETNITTDLKNKLTQIAVSFKMPQIINEMSFSIDSGIYLRQANISVDKTRTIKKRTENYKETLFSFQLNSNSNNTFQFLDLFEKNFVIEIQNEDNQPLNIIAVNFYQKPLYIVADLKGKVNYEIIVDTTLTHPTYDLAYFKANIKSELPQTTIENLARIDDQNKNELENKSFWQTKFFMWICILLGIAVIGYFAIGLLKDMKE